MRSVVDAIIFYTVNTGQWRNLLCEKTLMSLQYLGLVTA